MGLGRCGGTQVLQNLVSLSLAVLENTYLCTELPIVEARGGGRWRMIPASASSQERRNASEQGQGHRLPGEKSNIIYLVS